MTQQSKSDFWKEHVTQWKASDLSQAAYCQQHQLKLSTFTYWRSKQSKNTAKLMPITMPPSQTSMVMTLPGNIQIQLPTSELEHTLPVLWRLLREQH
ncbi:IS66 family insertion sequence element accessory protein TnpA [Microbulbifer sp. ZKSA006]|uniref:IS66 family insertion sequence element accessory protein TnpA n=1 Tax=Microbulbifer sp. ZKSA006 TaxID=3243390 RepID=UPI0040399220